MSTNPGLRNQTGLRTAFRIVGPILAVVGIFVCVSGFVKLVHQGESSSDASPLPAMGMFVGGFVVFAIGMGLARAGFLGVGLRYMSGEVMPVARDGIDYLSGGRGIGDLGRSEDATPASGPFCRGCGTRNDESAKFCDNCGARSADLELRVAGYAHPDAAALVARVQQEYVERYGSPDESRVDPTEFDAPDGLFLVGYAGGVPVATGAWRVVPVPDLGELGASVAARREVSSAESGLSAGSGSVLPPAALETRLTPVIGAVEIKRMYVVPEARRRGLSRQVLAELERTAAEAGHDVAVLSTGPLQPEAIALYEASGYVAIPGFGHYAEFDTLRAFGKRL